MATEVSLKPTVKLSALDEVIAMLEWKATLWTDIVLDNSLAAVTQLDAANQVARWVNWGYCFAPMHALFTEPPSTECAVGFAFTVRYQAAGLGMDLQSPGAEQSEDGEPATKKPHHMKPRVVSGREWLRL